MKIVDTGQMRELDRRAIMEYDIPGEALMDRAGFGVAAIVDHYLNQLNKKDVSVLLIAGRGNNGGDAFAAARYLLDYGYEAVVWLAGSVDEINGDALTHLERMKKEKIRVEEFPTKEGWDMLLDQYREERRFKVDAVVDGVLGTGIRGPARGPAAGAISYINRLSSDSLVVSIDIPSGLNSDTGFVAGDAVRADVTATMGLPKRGLVETRAADYVGHLEIVDIGLPYTLIKHATSEMELITASDVKPLFPKRTRNSHKGDYGHLLIFGGANGYSGAVSMAARSAIRSGVGLVTAVVPRTIMPVVSCAVPEAMVYAAPETDIGSLSADCWSAWRDKINNFSAVLVGPGMTRHSDTGKLVSRIMKECAAPLILDADALNAFENRIEDLSSERISGGKSVITPHPGEMGRMMGCTSSDIQADRFASALTAADKAGCTVVLKGAGTLIAERMRCLHINMAGNPGMATGGMGDVLAGLLSGMLSCGMTPFDAARASVFLHGMAGNGAARAVTESCVTAGDVIDCIPYAFQSL